MKNAPNKNKYGWETICNDDLSANEVGREIMGEVSYFFEELFRKYPNANPREVEILASNEAGYIATMRILRRRCEVDEKEQK